MVNSLVRLFEGEVEAHPGLPAWVFGAVGLSVLLLLLFTVTRFNPDR